MIWITVGAQSLDITPRTLDLPDTVLAIGAVGDCEALLPPAEFALIAAAVESRRQEFATGRMLARASLARLGVAAGELLQGPSRAAIWPPGVIGSISHCRHWGVAVTSFTLRALGADIECRGRVSARLSANLFTAKELAQPLPDDDATILFSAKEALFKAVHPMTGEQVEFQDVEIELKPMQRFRARYLPRNGPSAVIDRVQGAVSLTPEHVLTLAWL